MDKPPSPPGQAVQAGGPAEPPPSLRPPLLDSQELLRGHRSVEIHHKGSLYRLQATRQGKLILTK